MNKLSLMRLQKQTADIQKNPIENAIVVREGNLNFHFCLYGMHPPYSGGFYHGLLQLHEDYPLRAPKLIFFTPSGRFETNTPICTSFTNFHQQTWTAAWNVRTLTLATISFMYSDQPSHGCRNDSEAIRKNLAAKSKAFNMKNPTFLRVFSHKLAQMQLQAQPQDDSAERIRNEQLLSRNQQVGNLNNILLNGQRQVGQRRIKLIGFFIVVLLLLWLLL